jgi:hypothetical protein
VSQPACGPHAGEKGGPAGPRQMLSWAASRPAGPGEGKARGGAWEKGRARQMGRTRGNTSPRERGRKRREKRVFPF